MFQHAIPVDAIVYLDASSDPIDPSAPPSLPLENTGNGKDESTDLQEGTEIVASKWNSKSFAANNSYLANKDSPFQHVAIITIEQVFLPSFYLPFFLFSCLENRKKIYGSMEFK
jgi:hypothetical protein